MHCAKLIHIHHLNSNMKLLNFLLVAMLIDVVLANEVEEDYYIVYLGNKPMNEDYAIDTHINLLSSVKGSDHGAKESIVHSYTKSFNAFAAKLSSNEANTLMGISASFDLSQNFDKRPDFITRPFSDMESVVSVFRNKYRKLQTTKSWDFMGVPLNAKRKLKMERDIIVGLLDTGITPQSESFNDDGFGPPPTKWKGTCAHFANFSGCNNKIIGAKYFKLDGNPDPVDILSPIDVEGHGTHTSSTLAGRLVANASLFGLANGTARGAVPSARVAMYKVCWTSHGCSDMDILAAFDAAIQDGVDILSVSIGGAYESYVMDSISIGSFHALEKGIITVAACGNDGPRLGSVANHAPWVLTVGAGGMDRGFRSTVELGNGKTISGVGINIFKPDGRSYNIVSGADVAKNSASKDSARYCVGESLDPNKVKGKLVYCTLGTWGTESVVKAIGGVGAILESELYLDTAQIFMAPSTMVNNSGGQSIDNYIHSTRLASAIIHKSEEIKVSAPFVASFSSRGPNPGTKRILKPDVVAPGIDILAAYTPLKSLTGLKGDTQYSKFTLMSGTSMACPHVAGVAAYIKSFHPDWTPAAIKSAIITTANSMSHKINKDGEFAYGAGHVNPKKAKNPGLVFDMDSLSYIQFLCREGYNGSSMSVLTSRINCTSLIPGLGYDSLNYPTMQLTTNNNKQDTVAVFRRRVTNVGQALSVYNVTVKAPKGVEITVKPMSLVFSRVLQKRSFKVVVKAQGLDSGVMVSGSVVWKSPRYVVRSPVVVYSPQE